MLSRFKILNIFRVEVEEEAEKQRQIRSSWNNISNYELSTLG
jgi:hypothetical protein